jgi:hypothetical protein
LLTKSQILQEQVTAITKELGGQNGQNPQQAQHETDSIRHQVACRNENITTQ